MTPTMRRPGPVQVDDQDVINTMTALDLNAESLVDFRTVRHLMRYDVPTCCIAMTMFRLKFDGAIAAFKDENGQIDFDRLDEAKDEHGDPVAEAAVAVLEYYAWSASRGEVEGECTHINYTPCPACTLKREYVILPDGCPCCNDKAHDKPFAATS